MVFAAYELRKDEHAACTSHRLFYELTLELSPGL